MSNQKLRTQVYVAARQHHPAWQLLAARTAPIIISCLQTLFDEADEVDFEVALQALANLLARHENPDDSQVDDEAYGSQARKELREWIKRGLLIEREGVIKATDALETALRFVSSLDQRLMTSTASRLAVVQREISNLHINLSTDPKERISALEQQIQQLQKELEAAKQGQIEVLDQDHAMERIREVHNLASELRNDFRKVEDSYRGADKNLRQSIIRAQNDRGEILDKLLDSHDDLLETPEGRVFHSFQQQLDQSMEMEQAKLHLRAIINHPAATQALNHQQRSDLRWLFIRLNQESANVMRTRARSERDVKDFLKTGLVTEHHRVGDLLDELLNVALDINWQQASIRKTDSHLPPITPANPNLPLIERLRFKAIEDEQEQQLQLAQQTADMNELDDDFWLSFDSLDRQAFIQDTQKLLRQTQQPMGIPQLAEQLPPTHDLESITLWLSMAREAEVPIHSEYEHVDITDEEGTVVQYSVPKVELTAEAVEDIEWEL